MFSRLFRFSALALLLAVPAAGAQEPRKADAKAAGPAVLVRVQSINDLIATAKYVRTLIPGEPGDQFELGIGAFEAFIDKDKGSIEGIDVKNPIGLYVTFGEELTPTPPAVVLVPVADPEAVLTALKERAMLTIEKEKGDVYKTQPPQSPFPIYFRFANKYAYITINDPQNIDPKTLPKPETVLGGKPEHIISATLRIDRLPDGMKRMAIAGIENQLAMGKDQPIPNETKAIKEFKDKAIDELAANLKSVLDGGEELALRINVDQKAEEVSLELELKGTQGSKLARDIQSIKDNKSVAGGAVASPDAAANFNLSVGLSSGLKALLPPVVDDALGLARKEGNVPGEIQTKIEPLIKALLPTVKAGELDFAAAMIGPDKDNLYTVVAALKVVEGKKIETTLKDLAKKELPPEVSAMIVFDAEKLTGGASLHTVKLSEHLDEQGRKILGKSDLHLMFRDDLMVAAIGPGAVEALKRAATSQPADVGVTQLQVHLNRFVPVLGENAEQLAAARAAAEKVFGKGVSKADTIRFSIEGGTSLKAKIAAKGKAIQFLAEYGVAIEKKDQ
jgi:hypothetical protein